MVITPRFITPRDSGPRRRAKEARETARAKKKKKGQLKKMRKARRARKLSAGKAARVARSASAAKTGLSLASKAGKLGSRFAGPVGIALLVMDATNLVGSNMRRAEGGVSARLLGAMDQDGIYQGLDEEATGAENGRKNIEGRENLLRIIGKENRVNSQIAQLTEYFIEKETAIAIGNDLIEREPAFDHLETVVDKALVGAVDAVKSGADSAINAMRGWAGKGPITR
tara:strand:+ start:199 stop:879 length:681 start_codon:yes stop_codon:yes gene_type:complete